MAPRSQSDLVKNGLEGFALIDEYCGRKCRPQAPPAAAQRATGFQANQQTSHYRYHPQESYYRYQPQESRVVRVTKVSTAETIVMRSSYETAAPKPFGMPY